MQTVPVVLDLKGNGVSQSKLVFENLPSSTSWYFEVNTPGVQVSNDGIAWSNLNQNEWVLIQPNMSLRLTFNDEFKGQAGKIISCPSGQCAPEQSFTNLSERLQILNGWNEITIRNNNVLIEKVVVRDAMGKIVTSLSGSQTQWMIDTQSWSAGVYIIETQNEFGKTCTEKVMVQ